jgi:Major Facilitator Superfamily
MKTAQAAASVAAASASLVLLTLASGQVPDDPGQLGDERLDRDGREGRRHDRDRYPGTDHGLHARDGVADDHRREDRRLDRPQARFRDRCVLRSSEWGWIHPKADGPSWPGLSPTIWLIIGGVFVIWLFSRWEVRRVSCGEEPLVRPGLPKNQQLSGGLLMFFFQYLVQAGLFFVVPLFLSVCLGLTALETGARLLPLSITLLLAAVGIPRLFPDISPRLLVRVGLFCLLAGTVVLLAALNENSGPEVVFVPMLLVGLGIGALASQLGAVTVSAVPDDQSPEVGGVQNTMTNLGASLGTALAGSVMIAAVASSFLANIQQSDAIPARAKSQAQVELAGGVAFVSDADLEAALDEAGASNRTTDAALDAYRGARVDGLRTALALLALLTLGALFFAQRIPTVEPGKT